MKEVRRHPFAGLISGLIFGLGVAVLLVTYSFLPFGVVTLWGVILLGGLLGLLIGTIG